MPKTTTPSLWDFATAFYAKAGVQSACLTLQDKAGVNVPLLLCCCWVSKYYGELSDEAAKEMSQFTNAYSQQTTEPLRAIRASLKHSYKPQWPIKEGDWSELREQVKAIELNAERLFLQGLEQLVIKGIGSGKGVECIQDEQKINLNINTQNCLPLLDINQDATVALWNIITENLMLIE